MNRVAVFFATALTALCLVPQVSTYAEETARPACRDGIDNDGDGLIDHPSDDGCANANDSSEEPVPTEAPPAECSDGVDNDNDGTTDFPADEGCASADDVSEQAPPQPPPAECADGLDNDGDGATDYPADTDCSSAADANEDEPPSCRTVNGVEACMDVVNGAVVERYVVAAPEDVLTHVAGFVHLYDFTLPNGAVVTTPCVVVGVDSTATNPCRDAGGVFRKRLFPLYNDNVERPDTVLTLPLYEVRVCNSDMVMTLDGAGVTASEILAPC